MLTISEDVGVSVLLIYNTPTYRQRLSTLGTLAMYVYTLTAVRIQSGVNMIFFSIDLRGEGGRTWIHILSLTKKDRGSCITDPTKL